jgi:hypothetical protein
MAAKFLIPAILSTSVGAGLDIMGNALSQAYPDTPHWIWVWIFWIGVALVSALPLWFAWQSAQFFRPIFATLEFTWPVRRKTAPAARNKQGVAPPLPPGEQQFRTELRRFIKSNFDEIRDGIYAVNQFVTSQYEGSRGNQTYPLSRMFFQLFATAIRPHIDAVDRAYDLQDDEFDTSVVEDLIKKAMQSYVLWQEIVLQFQQISGISLADKSLGILLVADERAFGKLRDLKAFPHSAKLNDLDERFVFASRNGVFSQWDNATTK